MASEGKKQRKCDILKYVSRYVIGSLEKLFYLWGKFVAKYPLVVIACCTLLTGLSCLGFLNFTSESRAEKLWISSNSSYISNKAWLDKNFPRNTRQEFVIFESQENILTTKSLLKMLQLHKQIAAIHTRNVTWEDVCYRIPIANLFLTRKRKRRQATISRTSEKVNSPENSSSRKPADTTISTPTTTKDAPDSPNNANSTSSNAITISPPKNNFTITSKENTTAINESASSGNSGNDKLFAAKPDKTASAQSETAKNISDETAKSNKVVGWGDYDVSEDDYNTVNEEEDTNEESFTKDKDVEEEADFASDLPPQIYCDLVNTLNEKCLESSILEIWKFSEERIRKLTQQDIINAVNRYKESPVYGYKFDYSTLLGSAERNSTGHIVSARAALHIWVVEIDPSNGLSEEGGTGVELDLADRGTLAWEREMVDTTLGLRDELSAADDGEDVAIYANAARSFNDISSSALFFDALKLLAGYCLMFVFTMLMLGNINLVEHRFYLTAAGIMSVAQGLVIAYGLTSALGFPYTPIHAIIPFLCLGIGIDDMFVIVQCWYNLPPSAADKSLAERMGQAMTHAGVAITVTSMTDVFAFAIGAVSILPGLRTFCISCAIGIGSIYLLQASWFVAWFSLDQRRIGARRDGLIPCLVHRDWSPSKWSQVEYGQIAITRCAAMLRSRVCQILALLLTAGVAGVGVWGSTLMRNEFNPFLLLPGDSYLRKFIASQDTHFPLNGWEAEVYTGPLGLPGQQEDLERLDELSGQLEKMAAEGRVLKSVDSWWSQFKHFLTADKNVTDWQTATADDNFSALLSDFLYSRGGSKFKNNFRFSGELVCNKPAPNITATQFTINYLKFSGPEEHIPGRRSVENLIKARNFSTQAFSFSKVYAAWETDEVIANELWRNLGMSLICVFVITLILLADFKLSLLVLSCVLLTLVDLVGFLHFWSITIDTISCVYIDLAIFLSVDYSAHVAHAFMHAEGSSTDRSITSLVTMGPAVLSGGITTLVALVVLGFSQSHAFIVFFKVFLLTVIFGLFHAIVFLPVLLSIICGSKHADAVASEATASSTTGIDGSEEVSKAIQSEEDGEGGRSVKRRGGFGGLANVGFVKSEVQG